MGGRKEPALRLREVAFVDFDLAGGVGDLGSRGVKSTENERVVALTEAGEERIDAGGRFFEAPERRVGRSELQFERREVGGVLAIGVADRRERLFANALGFS